MFIFLLISVETFIMNIAIWLRTLLQLTLTIKYLFLEITYNLNNFDWTVDYCLVTYPTAIVVVNSFIQYLNLKQFNFIKNKNSRTLDLIFSDIDKIMVNKGCSFVPLADEHHPL